MRWKNPQILIFILLSVLIFSTIIGSVKSHFMARSSVIRVPDDYPTIQEAIDAANPGDIILVSSGVYHETLDIDKPLSLIGEDGENTFIIGSGVGSVVHISSDNVTLRGFTVKGSGRHYISPFEGGDAGVTLDNCKGCVISNLIVTGNSIGIFLNISNSNLIEGNTVYSNDKDGIHLRMSNRNIVIRNNASLNGGHGGIYLNPHSSYNLLLDNICSRNADHGIKLQESSNHNVLAHNTCIDNENAGIFLRRSNYNVLYNNTCIGNRHNPAIMLHISNENNIIIGNLCKDNDEGISLQHSSNNNWIINNTLMSNRRGIFLWSSNNIIIINNVISANKEGTGIELNDTSHIKIYYNDVLANWRGIMIEGNSSTDIDIHYNNIIKNVEWGLLNEAPRTVDAALNWWGDPSGPEIRQFVEETDQQDPEEIRGNIVYDPWLTEPSEWYDVLKLSMNKTVMQPSLVTIKPGGKAQTVTITITKTVKGTTPVKTVTIISREMQTMISTITTTILRSAKIERAKVDMIIIVAMVVILLGAVAIAASFRRRMRSKRDYICKH